MIMDTGAAISCMYDDWYQQNKSKLPALQNCPFLVMTADGSKAPITGYIPKVSIQVNSQLILTGLVILKTNKKGAGLLGLDALEQMDVLFDIKERLYVKKKKTKDVQTGSHAAMNNERRELCTLIKKTLGKQTEEKVEKNCKFVKKKKIREITIAQAKKEKTIQLYAATRVEIPSMSRAIVWTTATTQGIDASKVWVTETDESTPPTS